MDEQQTPPPLEEVVDGFIDDARAKDPEAPPSLGMLEDALAHRLEALDGADPDRVIRSGLALTRLGAFAKRVGALRASAQVGDEDLNTDPAAMRDGVARDLAFAINDAGDYGELEVLERAQAIRDLTEAYVRLGGEVLIAGKPSVALPPIRTNEDLIAGVWRRLNDAGVLGTAAIDEVVAHLRAELEAPVAREGLAG